MDIGFIGLGVMGAPMAGHLLRAGHTVRTSIKQSPIPTALLEAGIIECANPAEVAQASEIVITMLPDTSDVKTALFSRTGVVEGLRNQTFLMDMSTISPDATKGFAKCIQAKGAEYIDAPVSGGEVGAKNATLSIMVGGRNESVSAVMPVLELLGTNITHIGNVGTGQICKLANQIVVGGTIQVIAEALVLSGKSGADPHRVRDALSGGFASSRVLEIHGEKMIQRNFLPGFRLKLHRKDLGLALAHAGEQGVSIPVTAQVAQLMNACIAHGREDLDHSSLSLETEASSEYQIPPSDSK